MSALFTPIKLGSVEFPNRIVVAPMCQYSADDGSATDWRLGHLGMLANSGAGLVIVEATHVERRGRITHGCMGLYSDDNESSLARVITHCRRAGTAKLGIQIAHAGRKASAQRPWEGGGALSPDQDPWQTIAPSPIPFGPNWHVPRMATPEMTAELEQDMDRIANGELSKDEVIRDALGEHIFEWFLRNKRREWRDYKTHVSQFEIDRYLRAI